MEAKARNLEYEYRDLYININENTEQLAFYQNSQKIERERLLTKFRVKNNMILNDFQKKEITKINKKITTHKVFLKNCEVFMHKFGS